jgi:uncharacterized protein YndB with AHSA1/START domain
MIAIELSAEIKRPVEEVFAYLTDPEKTTEWNSLVLESRASPAGPLHVGSKIHSVIKFLGRRFEVTGDVTEYVSNRNYTTKSTVPFPAEGTLSVEPVAGGTKVTIGGRAEPGGFFKLAEPILGRIAKRQFQAQLDTLKEILEAPVPTKSGA